MQLVYGLFGSFSFKPSPCILLKRPSLTSLTCLCQAILGPSPASGKLKNLDRKLIEFLSLISSDTSMDLYGLKMPPLDSSGSCFLPHSPKDPSALHGLDFTQGTWASFVGSTHGSLATWEPCKDQDRLRANATSSAPQIHGKPWMG